MPQEASRTLRVLIVSDVRVVQEGLHSVLAGKDEIEVVSTVDTQHATEQSARLHPDVILFDAARHDSVEFLKDLVASTPDSKVVAFGVKETDEEILALAAAGTAGYVCNSAESSDVVKVLEQVMCDELTCSPRAAASLYRRVAALSRGDTDPVGNGSVHSSDTGNGGGSHSSDTGNGSGGSQGSDTGSGGSHASDTGGDSGSSHSSDTGDGSGSSRGNDAGTANDNGHSNGNGLPLSRRELQIAQLIDCGLTNKQIGRELGIEAATVKNHVHNLCEKLDVHRRGEAAARIRAISRAQLSASALSASAPDGNPALEVR
ncbi:MAG: regulatory protein LuxR [Gammaproteobacteria bacterium]|nr:regulatory protein LuxR [Gammaproteobacteria bacterium]